MSIIVRSYIGDTTSLCSQNTMPPSDTKPIFNNAHKTRPAQRWWNAAPYVGPQWQHSGFMDRKMLYYEDLGIKNEKNEWGGNVHVRGGGELLWAVRVLSVRTLSPPRYLNLAA